MTQETNPYNPVATGATVQRLMHYTKGLDDNHGVFVMSLTNCLRNRMWEKGWQTELYGMLTAKSFMAFVEEKGRCGIGSSVPWIYSRLALAQKIDRKIPTAEALELMNAVLVEETGHDAKWHYEQKVIQETKAVEPHGGDRKSKAQKLAEEAMELSSHRNSRMNKVQGDNITLKDRGTSAEYTAARLKRDRPDLLEKVANGDLSLNKAAIEAGFRRPPKPLDVALRAYDKLSPPEREEFFSRISDL